MLGTNYREQINHEMNHVRLRTENEISNTIEQFRWNGTLMRPIGVGLNRLFI